MTREHQDIPRLSDVDRGFMLFNFHRLHITEFHLQQGDAVDVSKGKIKNSCFNFQVV